MKVLYITPQFPAYRHGFELVELQELSQAVTVEVLSLRSPSKGEWEWLEASWTQGPALRINTIRRWALSGRSVIGCIRLLRHGAFWRMLGRATVVDPAGAAKVLVAGILGAASVGAVAKGKFDVIHADFASAPATVAAVLSLMTGIPFTLCGHAFDVFSTKPAGRATRFVLEWKLDRASVAFAENSKVAQVFGARKLAVMKRNAVTPQDCFRPERRPACRVVGLGALVRKKGFDLLIRAVAEIATSMPQVSLAIYGEGPERSDLEKLANDLGVLCELPGAYRHGDLPSILSSAAIVAVPSRELKDNDSDGVPTVFLEALNNGCAVVGTSVGAVSDLISDGETGKLVPPENVDALAKALYCLLVDERLREETIHNGRRKIAALFSAKKNAQVMIDEWKNFFRT